MTNEFDHSKAMPRLDNVTAQRLLFALNRLDKLGGATYGSEPALCIAIFNGNNVEWVTDSKTAEAKIKEVETKCRDILRSRAFGVKT